MRTRLLVVALAAAAPLGAQAAPGYSYAIRVTGSSPSASPGITGGAGAQSYIGQAVATAQRGRLDIVDGGVENLFAKGDYILFDSTDIAIVRPAQREFMPITRDASTAMMSRMQSLGVSLRLSDALVGLDSLGAGDTISGVATHHYRLTMAFNMAMDAAGFQQRLGSRTVTDYWVANVPGMPPNPLLRSNGLSGGGMPGMFQELSNRVDSVSRRMGRTIALRTVAVTNVNAGPGQVIESRQSSEVSDLRPVRVELSRLVVPESFTAVPFPGAAVAAGDGAKWKAPPAGR